MRLIEGLPLCTCRRSICVLATRNNQRLGDLAAGTLVVRDVRAPRRRRRRPRRRSPPERYASWDVTGVGDDEIDRRARVPRAPRPSSGPGARRALAAQLAARLRPLVAGARAGLADETFLEHLAAAKARGRVRDSRENG